MKRLRIVVLSLLLLSLTLACATLTGKSTPEPSAPTPPPATKDTPVPKQDDDNAATAPTPTTAPDDDTGGDEKSLDIDADALSKLDSYRMRMVWHFTDNDGTTQTFTIEQKATRDPEAQHMVMSSEDGESIEYIQIGDTQWVRFGDDWMQSTGGQDGDMGEFDDFLGGPSDMLSDINDSDYEDLGKETVNGIKTRHLRIDAKYWGAMGDLDPDNIKKGVADVWIADERNLPEFIVRMEMEVEGKVEDEEGKLELTWEVSDVNKPLTIEPPAEAADMGLPDDLPLCPNSSDLTTMGTMSMFSCEGKVADVNDFYTEQLTDLGWEKTQSAEVDNMFTSSWEKDGETIQLTVMENEDTGGASVMLVTGE